MAAADVHRQMIRSRLTHVARPDSRFHLHLDFAEFMPDFVVGDRALDRFVRRPMNIALQRIRHETRATTLVVTRGMIQAVAVVPVIPSILFYRTVIVVERRVPVRAGRWGR